MNNGQENLRQPVECYATKFTNIAVLPPEFKKSSTESTSTTAGKFLHQHLSTQQLQEL